DDADHPVTITAQKSVAFRDSPEEMAMVILVQGNDRFMGASGDAEEQKTGYYDPAKKAVDILAHARTKNTKGALWVYHAKVDRKVEFGPAESVSGDAIGPLSDFANKGTRTLNTAIQLANAELSKQSGRRILVIIGDGGDQDEQWRATKDATKKL